MTERAIQFGDSGRLSGVLTTPSAIAPRAVLGLVNAGFNPRSGPTRVYTQLARALVAVGIASFRFDLGGLGDSIARTDGRLIDRTRDEVGAAVDVMAQSCPGAALALGGICSGAEDSLRYADVDPRITCTVLVDPFAWRTAGWAWRHQRHRLYRRMLRVAQLWDPGPPSEYVDWVDFKHMESAEASRIIRRQVARGAAMHFIYTSGLRELFNHSGQLRKMFPEIDLGARTTVDFLPDTSHTQVMQRERDVVIAAITRRLAPFAVSV